MIDWESMCEWLRQSPGEAVLLAVSSAVFVQSMLAWRDVFRRHP